MHAYMHSMRSGLGCLHDERIRKKRRKTWEENEFRKGSRLTLVLVIPAIPSVTDPRCPADVLARHRFAVVENENNHRAVDRLERSRVLPARTGAQ